MINDRGGSKRGCRLRYNGAAVSYGRNFSPTVDDNLEILQSAVFRLGGGIARP